MTYMCLIFVIKWLLFKIIAHHHNNNQTNKKGMVFLIYFKPCVFSSFETLYFRKNSFMTAFSLGDTF